MGHRDLGCKGTTRVLGFRVPDPLEDPKIDPLRGVPTTEYPLVARGPEFGGGFLLSRLSQGAGKGISRGFRVPLKGFCKESAQVLGSEYFTVCGLRFRVQGFGYGIYGLGVWGFWRRLATRSVERH